MLEQYIQTNYNTLANIARTITHNRTPDWEDLLSEVVLVILESDRARMEALIGRNQMRYWVTRIMLNQYNSSTSPYHYKYRMHTVRHRKADPEIRRWLAEGDRDEIQAREVMLEYVEEALKDMDYFDRMVTTIYYKHGHSLNTLAAETGISRTTLYKAIKRTRHAIAEKLKDAK